MSHKRKFSENSSCLPSLSFSVSLPFPIFQFPPNALHRSSSYTNRVTLIFLKSSIQALQIVDGICDWSLNRLTPSTIHSLILACTLRPSYFSLLWSDLTCIQQACIQKHSNRTRFHWKFPHFCSDPLCLDHAGLTQPLTTQCVAVWPEVLL